MSRIQEKITVVVAPARDISTAMIPTSKWFSEYFWHTLYLTQRHTTRMAKAGGNREVAAAVVAADLDGGGSSRVG